MTRTGPDAERAFWLRAALNAVASLVVVFQSRVINTDPLYGYLLVAPIAITVVGALFATVIWSRSVGAALLGGAVLGFVAVYLLWMAVLFASLS